ncbi:MAG: hypothetical protein AAFQ45_06610 [Pseudomonadota bacterium]
MSKIKNQRKPIISSQAEIDMYVQRGRVERSKAFHEAVRALFQGRKAPAAIKAPAKAA